PKSRRWTIVGWAVAATLLMGVILFPIVQSRRKLAQRAQLSNQTQALALATPNYSSNTLTTASSALPDSYRYPASVQDLHEDRPALQMHVTPRIAIQEEEEQKLSIEVPGEPTNRGYQGIMMSINDRAPALQPAELAAL